MFLCRLLFFFFNDTATTEIYTLSLHDALPISPRSARPLRRLESRFDYGFHRRRAWWSNHRNDTRSEEHTSELQSHHDLVCRLLLEKKKKKQNKKKKSLNERMNDHITYRSRTSQ